MATPYFKILLNVTVVLTEVQGSTNSNWLLAKKLTGRAPRKDLDLQTNEGTIYFSSPVLAPGAKSWHIKVPKLLKPYKFVLSY